MVKKMKIEEMIIAVQKKLGVDIDGRAGPETWTAIYSNIIGTVPKDFSIDKVDDRSEENIITLLPEVQPYARALVQNAAKLGITIKVISAFRSYAEQDALYNIGRTVEPHRSPVTNAKGGYSNHNFGTAFDIGIFEGKKYLTDSSKYNAIGALGLELGLEWGGKWTSFVDKPHFQLRPYWAIDISQSEMLAEFRKRIKQGTPLFT